VRRYPTDVEEKQSYVADSSLKCNSDSGGQEIPYICRTRMAITVLTKDCHLTVS
jgi:hypothetical protein